MSRPRAPLILSWFFSIPGAAAWKQAIARPPLTCLKNAGDIPIDINTGIYDGHAGGAVPVSHSLLAYNLLAQPQDRIVDTDIERIVKEEAIPESLRFTGTDSSYGERKVLLRKTSKNVRVTITDGKHEILVPATMAWLAGVDQAIQRKHP